MADEVEKKLDEARKAMFSDMPSSAGKTIIISKGEVDIKVKNPAGAEVKKQ